MSRPTEQEFLARQRSMWRNAIDGHIKLKLAHAHGTSLLIPDLLAADLDGMRWFQPKFFYACRLSFFDGFAVADISIELCGGSLVHVTLSSGGFVSSLADLSQVFRCLISEPISLASEPGGACSLDADGDFRLNLFHHTTPEAAKAIKDSGHFRGSRWNVQGTRELSNVEYAYFTSLPKISAEADLARIAMASSGRIALLRTNATSEREAIAIQVYRQSTLDRTATLPVSVPSSLVATQHMYRHSPRHGAVHYEVCNPDIYRVGLQPGKVAPFYDGRVVVPEADKKSFQYVVLGDADTSEGLIAPFDEEETRSLLHVQALRTESLFDFWRGQENSDQVSWRSPELLTFKDSGTPTN